MPPDRPAARPDAEMTRGENRGRSRLDQMWRRDTASGKVCPARAFGAVSQISVHLPVPARRLAARGGDRLILADGT
jgi:hypothetical protein